MIHKEDSILINQNIIAAFKVAKDIERLSSFIPEYKQVKIISKENNKMVLEAKIKIFGFVPITYISTGLITENKSIKYEQIKGPLKGLQTEWKFEEIGNATKLTIIHDIDIKIYRIEELIYNLCIKKLANEVLVSMKKELERGDLK
ncbi:MAG: SRPBCC family protein [bacterium]